MLVLFLVTYVVGFYVLIEYVGDAKTIVFMLPITLLGTVIFAVYLYASSKGMLEG